jgi:hypothetical protein
MTLPTISCLLTFSIGPGFGATAPLGSTSTSFKIGVNALGATATTTADISDKIDSLTTTQGRNLTSDRFNPGTANFRIIDQNGDFNPANTSGPYYGKLNPGVKVTITATFSGTTYAMFVGYVQSFNYVIPNNADSTMNYTSVSAVDGMGLANLVKISSVSGAVASETTSARVGRILDAINWPTGMRTLDTGLTTVQADPGTTRNALDALQCLESTENGALYVNRSGYFVFKNKTNAGTISSVGTIFKDDGTNVGYYDAIWKLDNTLIVNDASITRVGGTLQRYTDTASVNKYFTHSISETDLLHESDAAALANATYYVTARAETSIRCDALIIDLYSGFSNQIVAALSLDIFDPLEIFTTQPGGTTVSAVEQVLGVQHQITTKSWRTTFTTAAPMVPFLSIDGGGASERTTTVTIDGGTDTIVYTDIIDGGTA